MKAPKMKFLNQEKYLKFLINLHLICCKIFGLWPIFESKSLIYYYIYSTIFSSVFHVLNIMSTKYLIAHSKTFRSMRTAFRINYFTIMQIANWFIIYIFQMLQMNQHLRLYQIFLRYIENLMNISQEKNHNYRKQLVIYSIVVFLYNGLRIYSTFVRYRHQSHDTYLDLNITILMTINYIASYLINYIIGFMLIMEFCFRLINGRVLEIIKNCSTIQGKIRNDQRKHHISMQKFCDLSDRLDQMAIFYSETVKLTRSFNHMCAPQFIVYTAWRMISTLFYMFLIYLKLKHNQTHEKHILGGTYSVLLLSNTIAVGYDFLMLTAVNYVYEAVTNEVSYIFYLI